MERKASRRDKGDGSIRQRKNGIYELRVSWADPATGQIESKSFYAATQAEVRIKRDDWIAAGGKEKAKKESAATFSSMTFGQVIDFWLDQVREGQKASCYESYRDISTRFLKPAFGEILATKLTFGHVNKFMNGMRDAKNEDGTEKWTDARRKKVFEILRIVVNYAAAPAEARVRPGLGLVFEDGFPLRGLKTPRVQRDQKVKRHYEAQDAARIMVTARDHRLFALFMVAFDTGARMGEIIALEWADLDWRTGDLTINKQRVNLRKQAPFNDTLKHSKNNEARERVIPLGEQTIFALKEHKERLEAEGLRNCPIMFPTGTANYLLKSNLAKSYHAILRKAHVPKLRFHDMRHTVGTLMANQGVSIDKIQNRLGHTKATTTVDLYIHGNKRGQEVATREIQTIYGNALQEIGGASAFLTGPRKGNNRLLP